MPVKKRINSNIVYRSEAYEIIVKKTSVFSRKEVKRYRHECESSGRKRGQDFLLKQFVLGLFKRKQQKQKITRSECEESNGPEKEKPKETRSFIHSHLWAHYDSNG